MIKSPTEKTRWMPLWTFPTLIVFAVLTVALRLSIVRTTYAIDQADRQIGALMQTREKTELNVTGLRSPKRLVGIARTRFGLSEPRTDQIVYIGAQGALPRGNGRR